MTSILEGMLTTVEEANEGSFFEDHPLVLRDLIRAVKDADMIDVYLTSSDQVEVPACRFVLGARSRVLKRMLYGPFREAKSKSICLMGYDSEILQAVVDYSRTNSIGSFVRQVTKSQGGAEKRVRRLLELSRVADYLDLPDMQEQVDRVIRTIMVNEPVLSCAVYDETHSDSRLHQDALKIIEGRPYVALETVEGQEGGIECIGCPDRIKNLLCNRFIAAGELFLFRILNRWFEYHRSIAGVASTRYSEIFEAAHDCSLHMQLENIEPQYLLEEVQGCCFVQTNRIFCAVAKQALRASKHGVWTLSCRSGGRRESVHRILVEDAGSRDANGIYYHIAGLYNGGALYSKREVVCGQHLVYTLSCSFSKDDQFEGRLFCSRLLTYYAVKTLCAMNRSTVLDPVFQPVMQVVRLEPPGRTTNNFGMGPSTPQYCTVRLSDGDLHMHGTLPPSILPQVDRGEIAEYSVVKILEFSLYTVDGGITGIHVTKASIVSANPGMQLGNPIALNESNSKREATEECSAAHQQLAANSIKTLYSFGPSGETEGERKHSAAGLSAARDGCPVPQEGWAVEDHGMDPSPSFLWIPASGSSGDDSESIWNGDVLRLAV